MALTQEQQDFVAEVHNFTQEVQLALRETRELNMKLSNQIKHFNKLERQLRDMARDKGLIVNNN